MAKSSSHLKGKAMPLLKRYEAPDTLAKEVAEDLRAWPDVVAGLHSHMRMCTELRAFNEMTKLNPCSYVVERDSMLLSERDASRAKAAKRIEESHSKCLERCRASSATAVTLLGKHMTPPPASTTERLKCRMITCDPLEKRAKEYLRVGIPCVYFEGEKWRS